MIETHSSMTDELRELIMLRSLDLLDDEGESTLEAHLESGCDICEFELRSFRKVGEELGYSSPLIDPPSGLKQRLLSSVAAEPTVARHDIHRPTGPVLYDDAGLLLLNSARMGWEPVGDLGILCKEFFTDEAANSTRLMRLPPGVRVPSHRHAALEELFVV